MTKNNIIKNKFKNFDVYCYDDNHSFIYADLGDKQKFLEGITDFILCEDNLLNYARRISKIEFKATKKHYVKLYHNIGLFLNNELEELKVDNFTDELITVLGEEYSLIDCDGELIVQKDKVGKIGEYIFHILLTDFFALDCIIPKFKCITDRNMSVFGIDTLYLDSVNRIIYFGESKFCKSINNGIILVNKSLSDYESQITEEYKIVLSNTDTFIKSREFNEIFEKYTEISITFEDFIKVSEVDTIGIPIFIAHGSDNDKGPEYFLDRLKKGIKRDSYFGMKTIYIGISFPIISKTDFIECIIRKAVEKSNEFREQAITL